MPKVSRCRLLTGLNERQSSVLPRPAHFPGRNSRSGAAIRASRRHHRRLPHDENRAGRLIGRTATSARWPTLSGLPPFLLRPRTNSHLRLAEKSVTQLFEQSFDFSGSRASQTASPTNAIAVTIIFFNVLSVTTSNSGAIRDRNVPPTDGIGRWKTACQSNCSHTSGRNECGKNSRMPISLPKSKREHSAVRLPTMAEANTQLHCFLAYRADCSLHRLGYFGYWRLRF